MDLSAYIDIHTHIIPGVDDGADSFEEALEMIKYAHLQGITRLIATPHSSAFDEQNSLVTTNFSYLRELIEKENLTISLMFGSEIYIDKDVIKTVIKKLKKHKYPTLNGTSYILVEFSPSEESFEDALYCVSYLADSGYFPIIAHAEKYHFHPERIYELKENGCLIQVNFEDILPNEAFSTSQKAQKMLENKMIDFLATDTHNTSYRRPEITKELIFLKNNCSNTYLNKVLRDNPSRMVP